jgi:hypothetical protein
LEHVERLLVPIFVGPNCQILWNDSGYLNQPVKIGFQVDQLLLSTGAADLQNYPLEISVSSRDSFKLKPDRNTRRMLALQILKTLEFSITERTLITALTGLSFCHWIAQRQPFLKDIDRVWRLEYALKYQHWTVEDWKRIL